MKRGGFMLDIFIDIWLVVAGGIAIVIILTLTSIVLTPVILCLVGLIMAIRELIKSKLKHKE